MRRLYDDKRRKRNVYVTMTTWRGLSVGAKHFYARVREDDNPIVEGNRCLYDDQCRGRKFERKEGFGFGTFDAALEWAVDTILEHFPLRTHKVWDTSGSLITVAQLKQAIAKADKERP